MSRGRCFHYFLFTHESLQNSNKKLFLYIILNKGLARKVFQPVGEISINSSELEQETRYIALSSSQFHYKVDVLGHSVNFLKVCNVDFSRFLIGRS